MLANSEISHTWRNIHAEKCVLTVLVNVWCDKNIKIIKIHWNCFDVQYNDFIIIITTLLDNCVHEMNHRSWYKQTLTHTRLWLKMLARRERERESTTIKAQNFRNDSQVTSMSQKSFFCNKIMRKMRQKSKSFEFQF